MKRYWSIIIIFLLTLPGLCQIKNPYKLHAFSGTIVISFDGGLTLSKSDYKYTKLGGRLTAGVEYYLPTTSVHILGFRGFGGGQQIYSKEAGKTVEVPDYGTVLLPDLINAEMYIAGLSIIYSVSIKDKFFPFVSGGISNIWFSPKIENGQRAQFNAANNYKKNALVYDIGLGVKYQIIDNLTVKLEGGLHFPNTDNLDDISTGKNKDFYATGVLGISYSFFGKKDRDGDGLLDNVDQCPEEPEDFDGFEDGDGCPDSDNDSDGVPDIVDRCPETPEDFDNFQDEDGCPDVDNDLDGIPDIEDECPNETEDIDGYEDEDGCPDLDNDGDLIPDKEDSCPDVPGQRTNNGCPDGLQQDSENTSAPKEIVIECEATFITSKAEFLPEASTELNRIVKLLQLYPDLNWRIEGHTDKSETENLMIRPLSLRRAEAILNYFISKGLPSFQFRVYDMGDRFPIANNNTDYGRMKNRRIALVREN